MLTLSRLNEVLSYDPDDGRFVWLIQPNGRVPIGTIAGCPDVDGYIKIKIDRRLYPASHLAWLYMTGARPEYQVDHKDGNVANNAWANLRGATGSQNCANQGKRRTNTSGYKGVAFHKASGKWAAATISQGKRIWLGVYSSPEAAHEAYKAGVTEHHGEFARAV